MPRFDPETYADVKERLAQFRTEHPLFGFDSTVMFQDGQRYIVHATIRDETDRLIASGHAEEIRDSSPVNKTSPLENCETSAWGRCLANMGYAVDKAIASRQEMEKVDRMERTSVSTTAPPDPIKARQAKAIGVIEKLSKAQRTAMRQLMMTNNISTKPDAWNTEEILDKVAALVLEARKAPADPEPAEATA